MVSSTESFVVMSARMLGWLAALAECSGDRQAAEAYLLQMLSTLAFQKDTTASKHAN